MLLPLPLPLPLPLLLLLPPPPLMVSWQLRVAEVVPPSPRHVR